MRLSLANRPHDYSGESEPVFSGIITHKYCGINIWQLYEELRQWMIEQHKSVTPTSPIGKALDYSMKGWKELSVYTSDSRLEIDNNKIENEIGPIAMGRKNYLFAGSHHQHNESR